MDEKNERTLMHLRQFRDLIKDKIHTEIMYRDRLIKKYRKDDLIEDSVTFKGFVDSVSYQNFLEKMLKDVFDDITL